MKNFSNFIVIRVIILLCLTETINSLHVLYGLFSGFDQTSIYYGTFDLDTLQFNALNSLRINDVGNPNNIKYSTLPLTYDPNDGIIIIAAPADENTTILSTINATSGELISAFKLGFTSIISLQYDIFQNRLFAHIQFRNETTYIGEINKSSGTIMNRFADLINLEPISISSYCPTSGQYLLILMQSQTYMYVVVNTSRLADYSSIPINFTPISMRYDYKRMAMYTTYADQPDQFISSVGILDRTAGRIDKVIGTLNYNPNLLVTSLSTYDISENIYYVSTLSVNPSSKGIISIDVDTSEIRKVTFPFNVVKSHGWFVKQFGDHRKLN